MKVTKLLWNYSVDNFLLVPKIKNAVYQIQCCEIQKNTVATLTSVDFVAVICIEPIVKNLFKIPIKTYQNHFNIANIGKSGAEKEYFAVTIIQGNFIEVYRIDLASSSVFEIVGYYQF